MARAAQMGKRLVARAKSADDEENLGEPRVFPIDLLPLLAPHKKHGKLTLRVERLPQQTRLSAGTRNSDGSWSLTRDELEDLEYIVPDGVEGAKALSVRVVSLTAGSTVAVLEYPIGQEDAPAVEGRHDVAGEDTQVERLRDELAKLKGSLAERDRALAAAPAAEASLVAAETRMAAEMDARLAAEAAKAALQLEQTRRAWDTEQSERLAKLEARAQEMIAEARERAQSDARETLLATERAWKAEEAVRLATAEASWREQLAKTSAEAEARVASAAMAGGHSDAELRAMREQVAALQATLGARDAAVAAANEATARAVRDAQEALAKAQSAWKSDEAARLAAAEAQWRAASAKAVAEAHAQVDAVRGDQGEVVRGLREQLSGVQATLAARDAALAVANEAAARTEREAQQALAAAEAQWRDASAKRVAEVCAQADAALAAATKASGAGDQEVALRSEVAALKAAVAERDAALKRADEAATEARALAQRDMQEALSKAEASWKAEAAAMPAVAESDKDAELRRLREQAATLEAKLIKAKAASDEERLKWQRDAQDAISRATKDMTAKEGARRASTEAQVRKEFADQLAHATSRFEAAETALAQIRLVGGKTDAARASIELDAARAALARRDAEVFRLRNELEELCGAAPRQDAAPPPAPASNTKRYVRDAIIAGAIGVAVVVMYPVVEGWMTPPPPPPVIAKAPPPPPPPPPVVRTAVLSVEAALRAGPSTKVGIVAPLDKGVAVTIVEERGEWIRVRAAAAEGKPLREGWVKVSQIKETTPVTPPSVPSP